MGYDPIDTDETDSNADKEITVEKLNGDNLVTSGETSDYEIQKDGSDSSGVINFKTS